MTTQEKIGLNLQRIRREKDLTQATVAAKANINVNTYAKIERGIQTATIPMLENIADTLGIELSELFTFRK